MQVKAAEKEQLIIINKTTNKLAFFENGEIVRTFNVATGKTKEATPEGTFRMVRKIVDRPYYTDNIPGGSPLNPLGDRWLGLEVGQSYGTVYAIHGNNNENSIGKYVSAGCVRMHNEEIRWLYPKVNLYTNVIILRSNDSFEDIAIQNGYLTPEQAAKNAGEELLKKVQTYNNAINSGNITSVNSLYDSLTRQLRTTESKIGQVPGSKNRDALGETYIKPAKKAIERTIYEVSQLRLIQDINNQISANQLNKAEKALAELERLKRRAVDIKKAGNYKALPASIEEDLKKREASAHGSLLSKHLSSFTTAINRGDIVSINAIYDTVTSQIKKTELKIGQVPGSRNRDALGSKYITPAKVAIERTIYEVSQFRLIQDIKKLVDAGKLQEATSNMATLERLKRRSIEIKKAGNYKSLPASVNQTLTESEARTQGLIVSKQLTNFNKAIDSGSITAINEQYDSFTKQLKLLEAKTGQVAGSNNRKEIGQTFITPAKVAVERTIYEVSMYRLMQDINDQIQKGAIDNAKSNFALLNRLERRSEEIKNAGQYQDLPASVMTELASQKKAIEEKLFN